MTAETYAALAELVDDNAQPLDQDAQRSSDLDQRLSARRMKASLHAAIESIVNGVIAIILEPELTELAVTRRTSRSARIAP